MGFQDSSWNISVSSLAILGASNFEISSEKQTTNSGEIPTAVTTVGVSKDRCRPNMHGVSSLKVLYCRNKRNIAEAIFST